ncbi:olfactory receptor 10A4-like [Pleurodeles waltl]|uniref:olfactory receptor 10A4-like n=1 Tax=Pleurodeles waltl TaxID=8319 RepID=UPI0037094E4E
MARGERDPAFTSEELEKLVDGVLPQYTLVYDPHDKQSGSTAVTSSEGSAQHYPSERRGSNKTMNCTNQSSVKDFILLGFSDFNPYLQKSMFVLLLLVYLATLIGNMTIVLLVTVANGLQTPMYRFLRNLSFLEICLTSTILPKAISGVNPNNSIISFADCAVQMFLFVSLGATECILLVVMAYDRHVAICNPLRYLVIMNPKMCVSLMTVSWMWGGSVSAVLTSFIFSWPYCGFNIINHFFCDMPAVLSQASADTFINRVTVFAAAMVCCICPFIVIILSYVNILFTILSMSSAAGRHRAFSTCSSHLVSVTLFYGSKICMYFRIRHSGTQERDKLLSILYSVMTPMLNPLIYSLRNKDVKDALKSLIKRTGISPNTM